MDLAQIDGVNDGSPLMLGVVHLWRSLQDDKPDGWSITRPSHIAVQETMEVRRQVGGASKKGGGRNFFGTFFETNHGQRHSCFGLPSLSPEREREREREQTVLSTIWRLQI